MENYNRAVKLRPDDAQLYFFRGNVLVMMGSYEAAIADYDLSIELKSDEGQVYYWRGMARENSGDYSGAQQDYEAAESYSYSQ